MATPPAIIILQARAEARAILYRACEYESYQQAVEPLIEYAVKKRLIEMFGAESIHELIENAFLKE